MSREDRQKRVSAARQRAETHGSGYETSAYRVPEGVGFFELSPGIHTIDIIPYMVKKGKETPGGNPIVTAGTLYFERTYWSYWKIGAEEKSYVCPSKTFGHPDYIQEYKQKESKNPNADVEYLKALSPKERQIFLVYDRKATEKGLQILDISYHLFGKLLDSRIRNSSEEEGWDLFYFPDEDGMTLRITVEEQVKGAFKFKEVTAIDFLIRREQPPEKIINHGIDLDAMLIEVPYEKLKNIFLGLTADGNKPEEEKKEESNQEAKKEEPKQEAKEEKKEPKSLGEGSYAEKEKPKEEKKSVITAEDMDIKKADNVSYKSKKYVVMKIASDGVGLTIMEEDGDEVIKVSALDCKPWREPKGLTETSKEEVKKDQPKEEKKETVTAASGGGGNGKEDDWDKGW